ncbi:MAG TPA: hypothetical protein VM661_03520 [Candidatus Sulfotelmatobacter sp.]|jgi:hypothetical protein|nr:hypothetical protein [Candidatus Sulfotelmatobacter sp.]
MPAPKLEIDKHLIFTVTSGRSGTLYLSELLKSIPGVASFHEPEPDFTVFMRRAQVDPFIAYPFWLQFKLPMIQQHPEKIYVETSHLLCKGFLEPLLRMSLRPSLIFLRRNPRQVAWSFLLRSTIPGRTTTGIQHLLDPRDLNVLPLINWQNATNYQLCFWYALEMEKRYLHYATMAANMGLATTDVTCDELNDFGQFQRLLRDLGLPEPPGMRGRHAALSAVKHNPNKVYHDMPADQIKEEEAVWDSVEHFAPHLRGVIRERYRADDL